ncbi:ankyrin repeat, SAM and basic leucine zipper domain-containing protein 1-like [Anthonomus grandis grandis]|uniref:ankyrin repeat, SAM and basic leucine zipper domain-containing protein 1-like n=1 Tax=Anthonomus grandis grandis TaxID=2921223 RepID=UPI0021658C81|nr:ankyrin repeat, SAM and basic leucine zipper domain-containing protein 1-like [Anthonomus grandis grandis]
MAYSRHGPDWSSDSEDSIADDGDYQNFKSKMKQTLSRPIQRKLTEEDQKWQNISEFFTAVSMGDISAAKQLLAKENINLNSDLRDGWAALMLSCSYGNPEMTQLLIDHGADVNTHRELMTVLMMACNCPEYTAPFEKSFKVIKLLVDNGANVKQINRKRMDALMYAACNGNLLAVEYLLPKSAKQAVDNQKWSALTWAVSNNQPAVVKYLISQDFDLHLRDIRGDTPLDIARSHGLEDVLSLFPKKEVDIVEEILLGASLDFEDHFRGLKKGEQPQFFEDVCKILISVKCEHLIPLFKEKNVTLGQFLCMDDGELKRLGVKLPFQRNRILTGLHRFHKTPFHPKSLHVCVKNRVFSNVDVATEILSAIKQIIAMEASIKYVIKHWEKEDLSKEERDKIHEYIGLIKMKIKGLKTVTSKLTERTKEWDALVSPADLITKDSIRSHFPWKKFGFCFGVCALGLAFKFKNRLILINS